MHHSLQAKLGILDRSWYPVPRYRTAQMVRASLFAIAATTTLKGVSLKQAIEPR